MPNFQTLVWGLRLFVTLQTFLLLFCICLKPRHFCTSHHKTTSKRPRIQAFWLYFAKKFLWLHKNGKSALTQLDFQTFLKNNVGNPGPFSSYIWHDVYAYYTSAARGALCTKLAILTIQTWPSRNFKQRISFFLGFTWLYTLHKLLCNHLLWFKIQDTVIFLIPWLNDLRIHFLYSGFWPI